MTVDELKKHLSIIFGRTSSINAFNLYLRLNEDVRNELQKLLDAEPWFEDLYRCGYCIYKGIISKVCCPACGKEIDAKKASRGRVYCSAKCSNNSDETKLKKLATTRKRYGTDYAIQSDAGKERRRRTNLERYGSACPVQNEQVRRKAVKTNLRKYGAEYPMQSKEYRDSIGYESPFKI